MSRKNAIPWPERFLSCICERPQGDFEIHTTHIPPDGQIVSWGQKIRKDGTVYIRKGKERWDAGERAVLSGLAEYDLIDVYRAMHGYETTDFSWYWKGNGKEIGRRFDHIFASSHFEILKCQYRHSYRETGLSDHAPLLAEFSWD